MARNSRKQSIRQERRTANRALKRGEVIDFQGRAPWQADRDRAVQTEIDNRYSNSKKQVVLAPRGANQEAFVALLNDDAKQIVFATGPAGTGKTLLAAYWAIRELKAGNIKKIVLSRPNVAVDDRSIGYLPGDLVEKMLVWLAPIMDYLEDYYTKDQIRKMIEAGVLDVVPLEYIRGRTWKRCTVLIDEAQGLTPTSMQTVLTRVGEGCKMIVTGDVKQSDIGSNNGLADFKARYRPNPYIGMVEFDNSDVQRSEVVKAVLKMYGG